jgi:hypothetical protein
VRVDHLQQTGHLARARLFRASPIRTLDGQSWYLGGDADWSSPLPIGGARESPAAGLLLCKACDTGSRLHSICLFVCWLPHVGRQDAASGGPAPRQADRRVRATSERDKVDGWDNSALVPARAEWQIQLYRPRRLSGWNVPRGFLLEQEGYRHLSVRSRLRGGLSGTVLLVGPYCLSS